MLLKIKLKIIEITGINSELSAVDFIDIIIKDYNYFTQQM